MVGCHPSPLPLDWHHDLKHASSGLESLMTFPPYPPPNTLTLPVERGFPCMPMEQASSPSPSHHWSRGFSRGVRTEDDSLLWFPNAWGPRCRYLELETLGQPPRSTYYPSAQFASISNQTFCSRDFHVAKVNPPHFSPEKFPVLVWPAFAT